MRGKARYNKPLTFAEKVMENVPEDPDVFTTDFNRRLLALVIAKPAQLKAPEAEQFIREMVAEGRWAQSEIADLKLALKKRDILVELDQLEALLRKKLWTLRKISPALEEILDARAEPQSLAESLEQFISSLGDAREKIAGQWQHRLSAREMTRHLANELAIRIVRIARRYKFKIRATGQPGDEASFSRFVRLIQLLAATSGVKYELSTWRNIVAKAKSRR